MNGQGNWYPDRCVECGAGLVDADGKRVDEWNRGYCCRCFNGLAAQAPINYNGAQNLYTDSTRPREKSE